ncbi:MAG: DNA translocase FtsK 4TM domain-containing protein, partial [Desulfotignum sp.]
MKKELTSLLLLFLIILTAVSLFSFHAQDPATGHDFLVIPDTIHNQFGLMGAHVAGFFIFLFGIGAFWVPVILSLVTLWYVKEKTPKIIWLTIAGGIILMVCTGAGFFLFKDAYAFSNTLIPAGGFLGTAVTGFLLTYANIAGCIIILLFFSIIGFILTTGISMVSLILFVQKKILDVKTAIAEELKEFIQYLGHQVSQWKTRRSGNHHEHGDPDLSRTVPKKALPATWQNDEADLFPEPGPSDRGASSRKPHGSVDSDSPEDHHAA